MSGSEPQAVTVETPDGRAVTIRSFCTGDQIRRYAFDPQFSVHAQYKSLYTKRSSLEACAALPEANVTVALSDNDRIIGFAALVPPEPDERWAAMGEGAIMEVKAVEVGRSWRRAGIARNLLQLLLEHPRIDALIVYMVGYSWTWDLDGEGLTAAEYRHKLIALFSHFDFLELPTNEPNVALRPENLFMSRIGSQVSAERQQQFKWLRFGIEA
jgi:acetoin utilization protein AcuA